jgi:pimeloyl-ACP methyl ester carboxylesterase
VRCFDARGMRLVVGALLVWACGFGCAKREAQAQSGEAIPPARSEGIAKVDVPGENRDPYVVDGNPSVRRPIVYLHGMCADPKEDLDAWGNIAKQHGTIVAVMGDVPCQGKPGRLMWSTDAAAIDAKIDAAIKATAEARGVKLEPGEMVVIGESMGAARAELIATKFPDKYSRLVLVGSPQTPSPKNLKGVKAVANLAGEKEQQTMMRQGTKALENAGMPTRFWELPEATHGNYGPDGERIMNEALSFVASR